MTVLELIAFLQKLAKVGCGNYEVKVVTANGVAEIEEGSIEIRERSQEVWI